MVGDNINELHYQYLRDFIERNTAIVIDKDKKYLIEMRLKPIADALGFTSVVKLIEELRIRPSDSLMGKVIDVMTTNETYFFRDFYPFELLKTEILPTLLTVKKDEKTLNIWCAASSTGQEPYSVAMLLKECTPNISDWKINFVATDISEEVLIRAREGLYSQLEVNRGLPSIYLFRYFTKMDKKWQLKKEIRDMVTFKQLNLINDWHMHNIDLILIRNVLIYFNLDTKKSIIQRISRTLSPGGYLLIGSSESLLGIEHQFTRTHKGKSVYYSLRN